MTADACLIDDFGPLSVVRPASVAEVGEIVRRAVAEGQALYPLGGRTMLDVGLPPTRPGLGVDLRGLAQVIDYPARDMTVTVQTGIPLAQLQRLLAAENQRLPIDVPRPEIATLGGALATNTSGPRRYGAGTLRDYVIGISTINDEGQETKAGGRVVKNVAGYDLCKLHIGALGTLGIITQVTLKVRPRPEARAILTLGCEADALAPLLDLLHRSRCRPSCIDVLNRHAVRVVAAASGVGLPETAWVVLLGFEDNDTTVEWQMQQLIRETSTAPVRGLEARAGITTDSLWRALSELPLRPEARLSLKANLLPGAVAEFCCRIDAYPEATTVQAHAGSGIVRAHVADLTLQRATVMLKELLDAAGSAGGNVVIHRCPPTWKTTLPVWGRPRGDGALMRQVKDALDSRRVFNPGRFVDGI
jgi:glycolate oxidase FAD binding subunit